MDMGWNRFSGGLGKGLWSTHVEEGLCFQNSEIRFTEEAGYSALVYQTRVEQDQMISFFHNYS